jgi:hypothetical protein
MLLLSRTLAILRSAELGFLGVIVRTWVHTPRFCGAPFGCRMRRCVWLLKVYCNAGALLFFFFTLRPLRINWLIVGTPSLPGCDPVRGTLSRGLPSGPDNRPH